MLISLELVLRNVKSGAKVHTIVSCRMELHEEFILIIKFQTLFSFVGYYPVGANLSGQKNISFFGDCRQVCKSAEG